MKSQQLKIKDLISIGIYTALYFLCVGLSMLAANLIIPVFSSILIPAFAGLISAPVYCLLCQKIPKYGAISLMGTIMGLFFLVSGHFILSFIPFIICGFLADIIQNKITKRRNQITQIISYIVFTFGCTGPILPLWFMKNAYIDSLINRGKDAAYIQKVFEGITPISFWICLISTILGAGIGAIFGIYLINKHFSGKAPSK